MDLSQLQGLLSFQATPEEQQRAMNMGLLTGGLGILSQNAVKPRGSGALGALGGALPGMAMYQNMMDHAPRNRLQNVQGLLAINKLQKDISAQDMLRQFVMGQGGMPGAQGALSAEMAAGGAPGPTNAAAARIPQATAGQVPGFGMLAASGIPGETVKVLMEDWKLRNPEKKVEGGYAFDPRQIPTGFLPQVRVSDDGKGIMIQPNAQGVPQMSPVPGAVEAFNQFARTGERARADYDVVPVPQSDGTVRHMPRSQAVQALTQPVVGQTAMPQLSGRPPAEQEAIRRVYEASQRGEGLSVTVPQQGGPIPSSAVLGVSQSPADRARAEAIAKGEGERAVGQPQANQRLTQIQNKAQMVTSKVDEALGGISGWTTGLGGAAFSKLPATPAKDLQRSLDTIRANLGFQEIQAMRDASPTGGALGQVAVQELEMLQAAVASLDNTQSPDQLRKNLNAVKTHFNNWRQITEKSYAESYPGQPVPGRRSTDRAARNDPLGLFTR